jgi:hypothetical protein
MSTRRYFAQKNLVLSSNLITFDSDQFSVPSSCVQYSAGVIATPISTVDITPWVSVIAKTSLWKQKTGSPNILVRGYPLQGPISSSFSLEFALPLIAAPIARTVMVTLTRAASPSIIRYITLDAEDDAGGIAARYVNATFSGEFLAADEIKFTVVSTAVSQIDSIILTIV